MGNLNERVIKIKFQGLMRRIIFFLLLLNTLKSFSQSSNVNIEGCWKVNYFASGFENTKTFPESIKMIYHFYTNGEYVYSVTENKNKNEQKGKYQISSNSLILQVDDLEMICLIFRMTEQEIVFKTSVENEELFFILNKINCK